MFKLKYLFLSIMAFTAVSQTTYAASDHNTLTESQVGELATAYFKSHPDKMLEIMQSVKQSLVDEQLSGVKHTLIEQLPWILKADNLPYMGNPKAKHTLLFFFDFQCVYCHKQYPILQQLIQKDHDLKIVFMPLHIFGDASLYANKAAFFMQSLGKYELFYNTLEQADLIEGKLNNKAIDEILVKLGIKLSDFKHFADTSSTTDKLNKIDDIKSTLGIQGTPFMFVVPSDINKINEKNIDVVRGYVSQQELAQLIQTNSSKTKV